MVELTTKSENNLQEDNLESNKETTIEQKIHEDFEIIARENVFKRIWKWSMKDKSRIGSIIFLFLFMVLVVVLAIFNQSIGDWLIFIIEYFEAKIGLIGIFIGVFIISIFANFTVIFPVPYTFALVAVAISEGVSALDIFIMGLFAGAGAAIGETSAWLLGKASKNVIKDGMEKQVSQAKKWIDKGLAPFIIFIFAATPLPDDAILLFIGLLGYALWKTIISCFIGKIVLTTATGYAAKYLANTTFGQRILWLFGLTFEGGTVSAPDPNIWVSAIVWIATILVIGVVLFVDWGDLWNLLSRSFNKRQLARLVTTDRNYIDRTELKNMDEKTKIIDNKKTRFVKESSFWQCSVIDSSSKKKESNFHDLYATSYVLEKPTKIMLDSDWHQKIMTIINSDLENSKINIYRLDKIILPKKLREVYTSNGKLAELIQNTMLIEFKSKLIESEKMYKFKFLLEKTPKDLLVVRCMGEKEALTIKQIKTIDADIIVSKIVEILNKLPDNISDMESVTIAYSYEDPITDESIIEGKID
ncbi:MAG TPA: VTT domain-containing protein [Candidatus Bathyarchaeia archaeon]|nr:VTT domain-containing protein [Candidatus Bathyarchaeia archaeon]